MREPIWTGFGTVESLTCLAGSAVRCPEGGRVALTAHLVMPDGPPGDAFLEAATWMLEERFGIGHATLQVVRSPFTRPCSAPG